MNIYEHLPLPLFESELPRQLRTNGGGFKLPPDRNKRVFSSVTGQEACEITKNFQEMKKKFPGIIDPALIFEIEINQGVGIDNFESLLESMGIHLISVAENRRGFWVVFSDDEDLQRFRTKLRTYGSETGRKYEFFNAISSLRDVPKEKKIGKGLIDRPLTETSEFVDLELWKMTDPNKNETFINQLKQTYNRNLFHITDQLITKSFVLLRVKMSKAVFDEIIELKEIARIDRPLVPIFNALEFNNIDISKLNTNPPPQSASGILIIDSGIISNHPLLEKCVGGESNFQSGERQVHDTVGHGTAVAGCAVYGCIEKAIELRSFTPSNWLFSAKVMYAEKNGFSGNLEAIFDEEKLVENQLKEAVESYLSNNTYNIKVVNFSLGNSNEIWQKHYARQLPLASLIDELAFTYPEVVFVVAAGNQHPINIFNTIEEIKANYPNYLLNPEFRIINPATAALALTVGSIAGPERIQRATYADENIKTPIASENQPSPFTRSGFGINHMIKPELVEYGGNIILKNSYGRIQEDIGGKIGLLNNQTTGNLITFNCGTSYSASKVSHIAGKIANKYPNKSANFIKNLLLASTINPFQPNASFYNLRNGKNEEAHLCLNGYGLPDYNRAINSFGNRVLLFHEDQIGLNKIKIYSIQLPEVFFAEKGRKRLIVTLTFNSETRSTRGDSYLGSRMEFHLFHTVSPQILQEKYGVISSDTELLGVPEALKKYEIKDFFPKSNIRKVGCHQKAWKEYKNEPRNIPTSPISLVLLNFNKWIRDGSRLTDYCISIIFEHEREIELYNAIRTTLQTRARIR